MTTQPAGVDPDNLGQLLRRPSVQWLLDAIRVRMLHSALCTLTNHSSTHIAIPYRVAKYIAEFPTQLYVPPTFCDGGSDVAVIAVPIDSDDIDIDDEEAERQLRAFAASIDTANAARRHIATVFCRLGPDNPAFDDDTWSAIVDVRNDHQQHGGLRGELAVLEELCSGSLSELVDYHRHKPTTNGAMVIVAYMMLMLDKRPDTVPPVVVDTSWLVQQTPAADVDGAVAWLQTVKENTRMLCRMSAKLQTAYTNDNNVGIEQLTDALNNPSVVAGRAVNAMVKVLSQYVFINTNTHNKMVKVKPTLGDNTYDRQLYVCRSTGLWDASVLAPADGVNITCKHNHTSIDATVVIVTHKEHEVFIVDHVNRTGRVNVLFSNILCDPYATNDNTIVVYVDDKSLVDVSAFVLHNADSNKEYSASELHVEMLKALLRMC